MKKLKRIFSLMIAAVMVLAMNITAFAADPTYTITIKGVPSNVHTFTAYQIFDGDLSGNVLSNITWGSGVNAERSDGIIAALQTEFSANEEFVGCKTAADVAKVLGTFANDSENIDAFASVISEYLNSGKDNSNAEGDITSVTDKDGKTTYTYKIEGLDAGYYFVKDTGTLDTDSDAYTKFILKLVKDAEVIVKTDVPTLEKKVKEDSTKYNSDGGYGAGYNDVADYDIGDHVPFKLIGSIPDISNYDTYEYIFRDTLSSGLTLDVNTIKVYVADSKNADTTNLTALSQLDSFDNSKNGYVLNTTNAAPYSFKIEFADLKSVSGVASGKYIIVEYTATLNSDAAIGLDGNLNTADLQYSNNPNGEGRGETPDDKVIVFTYELDVTKVDGASFDENEADYTTKLGNAEFVFLNKDGSKVAVINSETNKLVKWIDVPETTDNAKPTYEQWTTLNDQQDAGTEIILTSAVDGTFSVIGLDDDEYKLREIKAPDGYNLLANDFVVDLNANTVNGQNWAGTPSAALIDVEDSNVGVPVTPSDGSGSVTVENNKGATLPETGGIGTRIFYAVGAILMIGAAVVLISRKRTSER